LKKSKLAGKIVTSVWIAMGLMLLAANLYISFEFPEAIPNLRYFTKPYACSYPIYSLVRLAVSEKLSISKALMLAAAFAFVVWLTYFPSQLASLLAMFAAAFK